MFVFLDQLSIGCVVDIHRHRWSSNDFFALFIRLIALFVRSTSQQWMQIGIIAFIFIFMTAIRIDTYGGRTILVALLLFHGVGRLSVDIRSIFARLYHDDQMTIVRIEIMVVFEKIELTIARLFRLHHDFHLKTGGGNEVRRLFDHRVQFDGLGLERETFTRWRRTTRYSQYPFHREVVISRMDKRVHIRHHHRQVVALLKIDSISLGIRWRATYLLSSCSPSLSTCWCHHRNIPLVDTCSCPRRVVSMLLLERKLSAEPAVDCRSFTLEQGFFFQISVEVTYLSRSHSSSMCLSSLLPGCSSCRFRSKSLSHGVKSNKCPRQSYLNNREK